MTCFDYIVCGGGTSGCVIASRLASQTNASVLLVEAGRDAGVAEDVLVPGKYVYQLSADPEGLWQIPTVPQSELDNREIIFLRGKQLGGSSAVNYMALARGPAADYDEWARLVGDDDWKWDRILPLMKKLENFRPHRPPGFEDYAQPDPNVHGTDGPLKVGFGNVMTPGVALFFKACQEAGIPVCLDNNSGNPVGVSLAQFNTRSGIRSYAANAFLDTDTQSQHPNLQILFHTSVDKVHLKGNRATGVKLFDHRTKSSFNIDCTKEIILCQGTFGSPQLLMLSGIGESRHLQQLGIKPRIQNANVGANMLDHSILTVEYQVKDTTLAHNQIFSDPKLLAAADDEYARNKTGPHSVFGTSGAVAFPKIERLMQSKEFADLDETTQKFMTESTRPSAEIWLGSGPSSYPNAKPEETYITYELLLQNNLSKGTVSLTSSDPRDLPRIDPQFLEHPYDKRIAIETVRQALAIGGAEAYRGEICRMVHGPSATDDASILSFIRANLGQGYHSLGTCRMGDSDDPTAVVDSNFHVIGTENLRVADLSVCPILTCNHTQINAYLIGERCAERLIQDQEHAKMINCSRHVQSTAARL